MPDNWGSDVPISEPVPNEQEIKVDFEGFGFTMGGVTFVASQDELNDLFRPVFSPEGYLDDDDLPPLPIREEN